MRVVYFLPKYSFFENGVRGRTSHAHGFLSGLKANNIDCLLVSGPGYQELYGSTDIENKVLEPKLVSRINILWVAHSAIQILLDRRINLSDAILIVRYSTSMSVLTSLLFGLFWKGRTVYEINSIGYHQIDFRSKTLLNLVLAIEKKVIAVFDVALCISRNISRDLASQDISSFVLPNGSSLPANKLKRIRRKNPRFIYLGGYQPYYDFEQLFRCFLRARIPAGKLHMYGNRNRYAADFPQYVDNRSILFKGAYDLSGLLSNDVLSLCDVFVLPNGRNRMARIGSPTKLFEYLSFGSRIIFQDYGQARDILSGLTGAYAYQDDDTLIRNLELLADQFDNEFKSPATSAEYLATYTWEARVREFQAYLEEPVFV